MSDEREAKLSKRMRELVSFVLFLLIVILSLTVCAKASFLNRSTVEKQFTGYSYSSGVRENISDFVKDICLKDGISSSNVDEVFDYDSVREIVDAYYGFYISDRVEYSAESYKTLIGSLCDDYKNSLEVQMTSGSHGFDKGVAEAITADIEQHFTDIIEMPHMDKAKSAFNIGNVAMYVVIGVSAFFVLSLMLIEFFIGTKRQRSVRAIAISFMSAGIFELLLSLIISIIFTVKRLDVFPVYLAEQFISYLHTALADIAVCGASLMFASLIIIAVVWKMRKKD